jgi:hypothetical protein
MDFAPVNVTENKIGEFSRFSVSGKGVGLKPPPESRGLGRKRRLETTF